METAVFDTKPLLRPHQVEEAKSEIKACEEKLRSPHIEDKGEAAKQLRRLSAQYEQQVPRPPETTDEEGRMVARSRALLSKILVGMPSQEEMRKAPPGAVDKHMSWEKRNKAAIVEWKNLQLRLTHAKEPEAANLERHRPTSSSLSMDNAHIPGKDFHLPPTMSGLPAAFSDEQLAILELISPGLREQLATLNNADRRTVKDLVEAAKGEGIGLAAKDPVLSEAGKAGMKKKREMSKAQLDNLAAGRTAAKAARDAKKAK
jgi:hypothetical protein